MTPNFGYAGKILHVDLNSGRCTVADEDVTTLKKHLGGVGLGSKILYEEVPPGVQWSDPQNRIILMTGPLAGTKVMGSGTFCIVTKGPMTDGATSSQANGFLGAYLKFAGFDGIVMSGKARSLSYLYVHDGTAEIRDAQHLSGKDTWETEELIKKELGLSFPAASVFCIGAAGEKLVRYAALIGDRGHVAGHNGSGAVFGAKNLKAIVALRGNGKVTVSDDQGLMMARDKMFQAALADPTSGQIYKWGMLWPFEPNCTYGRLPFKNYTTNVSPMTEEQLNTFRPEYLRSHYELKPNPCWACRMHHHHTARIADGEYGGCEGKEPEYEGLAAMGPQIGVYDGLAATMLSMEADRLGLEVNEAGWTIGMAMECYEKGLLSKKDTDGVEMTWGNIAAARAALKMIAHRKGFGNLLADGCMIASRQIGPAAQQFAIHSRGGNTPRTHDHRRGKGWLDLFDTCVSNTGVNESYPQINAKLLGLTAVSGTYAHADIASLMAESKGYGPLIDSLGVCMFTNVAVPELLVGAVNSVTGWDLNWMDLMRVGERAVHTLRAFNIRHGYTVSMAAPSPRYGSVLPDGPDKGIGIAPVWNEMLDIYYAKMGWDRLSGKPLPETLRKLDLGNLVADLWPETD